MKLLSGRELAGYIKERQARQVRGLKQAQGVYPKLAIIKTKDDPVINTYVRLKQRYGSDIGVDTKIIGVEQNEVLSTIKQLDKDPSVQGIIVQLPLDDPSRQEEVLNAVSLDKDVDGLAKGSTFDPATPTAIMWLLAGYDIDLRGKKFAIIGTGPLVGAPLARMLSDSGYEVVTANKSTPDIKQIVQEADVIVTATGVAGLITNDMVMSGVIIIDAGVAVQSGKTVGDVASEVYQRQDVAAITPRKGGVGPLTVCALFENVIKAARRENEE